MTKRTITFTIRFYQIESKRLTLLARRLADSRANTIRRALRAYDTAQTENPKKEMP